MFPKRSYILKQTCSWKLQVCLDICDVLVDTDPFRAAVAIVITELSRALKEKGALVRNRLTH